MSRAKQALLALLAVACLLGVAAPAASASSGATLSPTRLMVLGDSISAGFGGDWTWRNWLWREIRQQGVAADMVGPNRLPGYGTRYERSWDWDSDHASVGGITIEEQEQRLPALLAVYDPDVVVVQLGVNDALRGASAATVSSRLQSLVRTLASLQPRAQVLLLQVPQASRTTVDAVTARANALVARWAWSVPRLTLVRVRTSASLPWRPAVDTFDGLHPNATGQTLLAQHVAAALHGIGVLPRSPSLYRRRTWAPDVRPHVLRTGGTLLVDWRVAAQAVRMHQVEVLVDGRRATGWLPARSTDRDYVTLPIATGAHRVQLVARRTSMVATPGPVVEVPAGP